MRLSPGFSSSAPPLKKYVTCAYFSVSATWSWRNPCSASTACERLGHDLLGEHGRAVLVVGVPGHRRQVEARVEQDARELPGPVRPEVEEDHAVTRLDARRALDHDRLDELVRDAGVVARLHPCEDVVGLGALPATSASNARWVRPSACRGPSRSTGRRRRDPVDRERRDVAERRMRGDVAAVGKGVDPGLLGREPEQCPKVADVRVDAALRDEAEQVDAAAASEGRAQGRVLEERPDLDRLRDAHQILVETTARAGSTRI